MADAIKDAPLKTVQVEALVREQAMPLIAALIAAPATSIMSFLSP